MTEATILDREYDLVEESIILKLENQLLLDQLNKAKGDLVEFLREKLNNSNITIYADVIEIAEQKKTMYSNSDKFKFLAEKYPIIEELKKKLGLEFDY